MSGLNEEALRPLYAPWAKPDKHRQRDPESTRDDPLAPLIVPGRRPSKAVLVPTVRNRVDGWRAAGYPGATPTTLTLLRYWFDTAHAMPGGTGEFRYHFAQREAVETIIYLYEIMRYRVPSELFGSLLSEEHPQYLTLTNVPPKDDLWADYATKLATGGGKTKCMSLVVAWSYFNAKYEPDSDLAKHFVIIAPNLIVFDRLRDDFASARIFYTDPVLPPEMRDAFNVQVVLQDETGGGAYEGSIYLTNIHRLYGEEGAPEEGSDDAPSWAGPKVNRNKVFKIGEALRARITDHPAVMVLNDEAHHLHDPESAWNEALARINDQSRTKGHRGVILQCDFTATPKHNDGRLFSHIVSDFPLGEAVDAGIVKVPVIGRSGDIHENTAGADAFDRFRAHLMLGYQQYVTMWNEWKGTRKPILFVMTESKEAANEISQRLNDDDRAFPLLKGRVLNLHTKLKGKVKSRTVNGKSIQEFVPSETQINDDDLRWLRKVSSELDEPDSPFRCVVSVLMLREGWDVKNVTTIIPLRKYNADSRILAEQTLGRGLRRMTPPGPLGAIERVTVVEHPNFVRLYEEELAQEGLDVIVDPDLGRKPQTVTIYVEHGKKPVEELDIAIPHVSESSESQAVLENLDKAAVANAWRMSGLKKLPLGAGSTGAVQVVEQTLLSQEVVQVYELDRGLLAYGWSASSVFVKALEKECRLQGANKILNPLIVEFIQEHLFEKQVDIFSEELNNRLGQADVRESIREIFVPLIRARTTIHHERKRVDSGLPISLWQNFQATNSLVKPCIPAERTLFNLVPCDRNMEADFVDFMEHCSDVRAFAKNAGPQKLAIDYLPLTGRRAYYWPDFFVATTSGKVYLVECKGQEDTKVALKARAAVEWCKSASTKETPWEYVYVPQVLFESHDELSIESLARTCAPKLKSLLGSLKTLQAELPLEAVPEEAKERTVETFLGPLPLEKLPKPMRPYVEQAINLLIYDKRMAHGQFGSAFQALLYPFEELCSEAMRTDLESYLPTGREESKYYFQPYLNDLPKNLKDQLENRGRGLESNLVRNQRNNLIGCFLFCLQYAVGPQFRSINAPGIWTDIREAFNTSESRALLPVLDSMNRFRNKHVAHLEDPLTDYATAEEAVRQWVAGLILLAQYLDR